MSSVDYDLEQKRADRIVRKMVIDSAAGFELLKLPNGSFGAFWCGGYDSDYSYSVAQGDYVGSLACMGDAVTVVKYIKAALDKAKCTAPDMEGGLDYKVRGFIAKTLRAIPFENKPIGSHPSDGSCDYALQVERLRSLANAGSSAPLEDLIDALNESARSIEKLAAL